MSKYKYNPHSLNAREFINHEEIIKVVKWVDENKTNQTLLENIIKKAKERKGLNHREAALLLMSECSEITEKAKELALQIKDDFYGKRVVLFAPLYLSNYCVNNCIYCPYNSTNLNMPRLKLTQEEIKNEVIALQDMGHKRLALEAGEHPDYNDIDYIIESIDTIYKIAHKNGKIRRVNVNIAATSIEDYRKLKEAKIGTYLLFQETYHEETYNKVHPTGGNGLKFDYAYHTEAMDRAMQAGIDDVGIGALFGLYNVLYEFIALLMHAEHLECVYGVGPHTISVPRIRSADGVDANKIKEFGCGIDDNLFVKIVAVLRISTPYTGIIISTREGEECRRKALEVGASQISGGSKTNVGGYSSEMAGKLNESIKTEKTEQFETSDKRTLDEIVRWLLENGQIPSFCTACYSVGRVGEHFMELCKSGEIQTRCHPNALLTLQEYLIDYASDDTKIVGEKMIKDEIARLDTKNARDIKVRSFICEKIKQIIEGSRGEQL
ncbi:MAG: [FeFe] hydrogenase H-cluster radical SAM maturase HydG [Oscillospiraceae bacterium]|nr:[FeFe] hydrogenase H-cluster radical SAM maturase HydG [Oscillospiraceae bacterium]